MTKEIKPQLVGLNGLGNLSTAVNYDKIRTCLRRISPADAPIHIKSLNSTNFNYSKHIWAALLNTNSPGNDYEINKFNLDVKSYCYQKFKTGGVFTDDYNNTIFIYLTNHLTDQLSQKGFFGTNIIDGGSWDNAVLGGGGMDRFLSKAQDGADFQNQMQLVYTRYNRTKFTSPIVLRINTGDLNDFEKYGEFIIMQVLSVALQLIPGLGTAAGAVIMSAAQMGIKYAKGESLGFSDLVSFGKGLAFSIDGAADSTLNKALNYVDSGVKIKTAYDNKDYITLSNELGISQSLGITLGNQNDSNNLINLANKNDVVTIANESNLSLEDINFKLSQFRNQQALQSTAETVQQLDTGVGIEKIPMLAKAYATGQITGDDALRQIMVNGASGALPSIFPTSAGANDYWNKLKYYANSQLQDPITQDAIIKMQMNLPVSSSAFDDLLLLSLEKQIEKGNLKVFLLPAELPANKAQCFASELATAGISVAISGTQAVQTGGSSLAKMKASQMDKTTIAFTKKRKFFS